MQLGTGGHPAEGKSAKEDQRRAQFGSRVEVRDVADDPPEALALGGEQGSDLRLADDLGELGIADDVGQQPRVRGCQRVGDCLQPDAQVCNRVLGSRKLLR